MWGVHLKDTYQNLCTLRLGTESESLIHNMCMVMFVLRAGCFDTVVDTCFHGKRQRKDYARKTGFGLLSWKRLSAVLKKPSLLMTPRSLWVNFPLQASQSMLDGHPTGGNRMYMIFLNWIYRCLMFMMGVCYMWRVNYTHEISPAYSSSTLWNIS